MHERHNLTMLFWFWMALLFCLHQGQIPPAFGTDLAWIQKAEAGSLDSGSQTVAVTQEIRYHMPEAEEVQLKWGINGWQTPPEALRPVGTVILDKLWGTPMVSKAGIFVAKIRVPANATIN